MAAGRQLRPWDPPLTDAGVLRAWTVGKRIRAQAAADGYALHRVLVSPFHRCLQTAAQAVAALCAVPDDAALAAVLDSSANVPLDTSRVKGVGSSVACFGATGMEVYEVEYCAYAVLEKQPGGVGGGDESVLKVVADRSGPTTGIHYLVT
uniref:Uncharacterized protein n=1 Tax=Aegilops tauschii TaxID=37682 RepID=R7WAE6_AEGTA